MSLTDIFWLFQLAIDPLLIYLSYYQRFISYSMLLWEGRTVGSLMVVDRSLGSMDQIVSHCSWRLVIYCIYLS